MADQGDSLSRTNNPLKEIGELFGNIGWDKSLSELKKEEVLAMAVILKEIEGLEDVCTEERLTELFIKYRGLDKIEAEDIPF